MSTEIPVEGTTAAWLDPSNPHNVATPEEFIANLESAWDELKAVAATIPNEAVPQFKADLAALIAKFKEIKEKI